MLHPKKWSTQWGGRELTLEVGKFALQADQSCTVQYGDTTILATVVKSESIRDGIDYFPLMVNYEEKLYAAGKIKGSRFIKREGRPTDESILSGRVIDRALRPLFDERVRNDIQVVLTALSVDQENDATIAAMIAASAVLSLSSLPWDGPIAGARIGRKNGEFILNVTKSELEGEDTSELDLVIAGTPEKIIMVEAGASEVAEDVMYEAIAWGAQQLKPVVELIARAQKELGVEKEAAPTFADDAANIDDNIEEQVRRAVEAFVGSVADTMIFDTPKVARAERTGMVQHIKEAAAAHLTEKGFDEDVHKVGLNNIKLFISKEITKRILEQDQRLDNRGLREVRELLSEVDLLPRVHGSAMFMRGDTQVLSIVTLGAPGDKQMLDGMEDSGEKRYMHHYNDGPYTYGDVFPMRGPSRRAIGHGALAERALMPVLPTEADFPYTIRVMSEVMGSNGSSSMASTCGSTLSLMAAGVPIKKPVAGIAMGLASDLEGTGAWKVLTDLQDVEDGPGGMDFKITGTRDGVTAMQMDTKTKGLVLDILKQAIHQAKDARMTLLDNMAAKIAEARTELSPYAPRIETIMIDPEKIGDIIGPGGKVIKKITEETGAQIDIEQDGRVMITTNDGEAMQKAREWIEMIVKEVEAGEIYDGTVVRIEDFGAFVNILPGKDGLVHVSEIAWERTNNPSDVLKMGQVVKVQVKEIDKMNRVSLSMKSLLPRPENMASGSAPRSFEKRDGGGSGKPPARKGFFKRDK
ncbi:MAG: polyribonucleotide nucleotidyltransferase [Candidatus Magasanikbacteria bacterium CG10_big_fil_rev_8_21_14_0_10_43_6]|uniref:Polyribonucleotide nucleotidyltransferase n=1 Tax=Candidatus Magasanikbacteria bacterium CG10_big_fil_rev_8_21_14_0_10_43_6 TaxID=1974650 RepID=A0A2M6W1F9_9BACT|nr:MAG: polyribonucleotide nucleotidyltransferase [Candidatus Magasanikbacteria bacterium CG10_big_fil_rev_8_21_14_0_10_43_6]